MTVCNFHSIAKNRISISAPTPSADSYGGRTSSFSTLATVWAQIKPVSGNELWAQGATQSRTTHKVLIRYIAALSNITSSADHKVVYGTREFGIKSVRNLNSDMTTEGKHFQELLCEENGPDTNG